MISGRTNLLLACLATVALGIAAGICARGAPTTEPSSGISLKIAANDKAVVSGYPVPVNVTIVNRSKLPLLNGDSRDIFEYFACSITRRPVALGGLFLTCYGRSGIGWFGWGGGGGNGGATATPLTGPGTSRTLPVPFPLARLYDLTIPGTYEFRLTTQAPVQLANGTTVIDVPTQDHRHLVEKTIGKKLCLMTGSQQYPQDPRKFTPVGKAQSNVITLTVLPPYLHPPAVALVESSDKPAATEPSDAPGRAKGQPWLSITPLPRNGTLPVLLQVYFHAGKTGADVTLYGDPELDFHAPQVDGPDDVNGGAKLVEKPTPHYVPVRSTTPVPLTAYGDWAFRTGQLNSLNDWIWGEGHRPLPKNLPWKIYKLEPGHTYKYMVPVNLSDLFDMSMPGTYHVRLWLPAPPIGSPWTEVRIPQWLEQRFPDVEVAPGAFGAPAATKR
jgi:hypothetical protein